MSRRRFASLGLALAGAMALPAFPVGAQVIDFEDLTPANHPLALVSEEYAQMGVHFISSDDGAAWDGMESGDPGGWLLTGSRGDRFLGFDGRSYAISVAFDAPVESFEVDVARAAGAMPFAFDLFQVTGFLDGQRVESKAVFFGGVNRWQTVSLSGPVDKVTWFGTGLIGHRFGVDNLRWSGSAPQTLAVAIDVRPGSDDNPVQLRSRGMLPVVLFGAEDFAVEDVDGSTLAFGPDGASLAHRNGPHLEDVDGDGWVDLVLHYRVPEVGLGADDVEACLGGSTLGGVAFMGCDGVTVLD